MLKTKFTVLDLFSGAGGLSRGFLDAGFNVVLGVDNDEMALKTFSEIMVIPKQCINQLRDFFELYRNEFLILLKQRIEIKPLYLNFDKQVLSTDIKKRRKILDSLIIQLNGYLVINNILE